MKRVAHVSKPLERHLVPIEKLSVDPANARLHDQRSIDAIAASLKRFGQQKPIVCDAAGVTVAGAGVLLAAKQIKWTHLAAVQSQLTGTERIAFAIADNHIPELSTWDQAALRDLVGSMPADLAAAAGYTQDELDDLMRDVDEAFVQQDEIPKPAAHAVTRSEDLWLLGEHRLLCGNSTKADDVSHVMNGKRATLFATDPPYLVGYDGMEWDRASRANRNLYVRFMTAALPHLAKSAAWYCWHASVHQAMLHAAWRRLGAIPHCQIIWVKNKPTFGRSWYMWQHEPCLMGWRKGANLEMAAGASKLASIWTIDTLSNTCERPDHPTPKPIEIFSIPMEQHTARGDVCYEPFSGSGSQLIAAEQLGRRCFAIELEPRYVDVAICRWQKLTGKKAILEGSRSTWAQVAKQRGVRLDGECLMPQSDRVGNQDVPSSQRPDSATNTPRQTSRRPGRRQKNRRTGGATARRGANSG
ncbi:MAG: DNA modification methylase [Phycisphaerales bacterium]